LIRHRSKEHFKGIAAALFGGHWSQYVHKAFLSGFCCLDLNLRHLLYLEHVDGSLQQVPYDGLHVTPYIANLRKFCGLNLHKRCLNQSGEAPCNLGLTDSRWPHHEDILGENVFLKLFIKHAAPETIAKSDRHRPLCSHLPHYVPI